MKIKKIGIALTALAAGALPIMTQALSVLNPSVPLTSASIQDTVIRTINWVLTLLGIVAVIMILYGGFVWLTAGGSEERVGNAKKIIGSAVVGIVIVLLAWAIVNFVLSSTTNVTNTGV